MLWGYNTNGCQNHSLEDAIFCLADMGYQSVAITLDHHTLNPFSSDLGRRAQRVRRVLTRCGMQSVIETGARYLLDRDQKHYPTLVTQDAAARQFRIEFLKRAVALAADLSSHAVSFWSGAATGDHGNTDEILAAAMEEVLTEAEHHQVVLALEAEPEMWIDTTTSAIQWVQRFDSPWLGLTIDIGHMHCLGEFPLADHLRRCGPWLRNVHIEDMRQGEHQHLMFGEGEIELAPVLAMLRKLRYASGVHVELSRHSHAFPEIARRSLEYLRCHDHR